MYLDFEIDASLYIFSLTVSIITVDPSGYIQQSFTVLIFLDCAPSYTFQKQTMGQI